MQEVCRNFRKKMRPPQGRPHVLFEFFAQFFADGLIALPRGREPHTVCQKNFFRRDGTDAVRIDGKAAVHKDKVRTVFADEPPDSRVDHGTPYRPRSG